MFLDDGTFRSYWGTGGETAFSMKEAVVKKLQAVSENPLTFVELYRIFEIRDREVRLLDDDELVVPLMKEHRTLLCSNKFNIQGIFFFDIAFNFLFTAHRNLYPMAYQLSQQERCSISGELVCFFF